MKKKFLLFLVIASLLACKTKEKDITDNEKTKVVTVSEVVSQRLEIDLRYSGTVEASQTIPLTFQSLGIVEKVYVEEGDEVIKGQILATVDQSDAKSVYDMSLSKYQQAKDAYNRLKMVHDQGSLPDIKWVEMETNMEQAKSSLQIAENNLNKCQLKSPADGVIGRRNVEPGMYSASTPSAPLEIVDIRKVNIKISVPENEIGKIKKGIGAKIIVTALDNRTFEGIITQISPVADAISRTYEAKISVENFDKELKPGMVCDVLLGLKTAKDVVLVPYSCVTTDNQGKTLVYLVNKADKKVKKQIVQTGDYRNNQLEILNGLIAGQLIVYEGSNRLTENSIVEYK